MNPLVELEGFGKNFGLKDLGTQLLSFKHETTSTLTSLNAAFDQFRLELQGEMKLVGDEMVEQKSSLDRAWAELEALQAEILEQKAGIQILKTDVNNLERNVESEKQKHLHLDFYSLRENLRLIGVKENGDDECVKENGDEDCEKLVRKILDEIRVLRYCLDFHPVHRVPRVVRSQKDKQDTPRQMIMRFTSRKDRDRVWAEKEKIKNCKEFSSCFFVADLPREVAQERAQLKRIAVRARDILKIKVEVKNDKLVLLENNLRYKLEEIPEYLKSGENKP